VKYYALMTRHYSKGNILSLVVLRQTTVFAADASFPDPPHREVNNNNCCRNYIISAMALYYALLHYNTIIIIAI